MKRTIVYGLEWACGLLDRLPGQWGCRIGLARRAATLDERWQNGALGLG